MRKELCPAFEVLIDYRTAEQRRIDLEQDEVSSSAKKPVGHAVHLMRIRTVHETLALEAARLVFAGHLRRGPFGFGGEVEETHRGGDASTPRCARRSAL
jgi:hypothetical protein